MKIESRLRRVPVLAIALIACLSLVFAALPLSTRADADTDTVQIKYDDKTEIHYVLDPESANGRIILYCMNNQSHWPHTTPSIPTVPPISKAISRRISSLPRPTTKPA